MNVSNQHTSSNFYPGTPDDEIQPQSNKRAAQSPPPEEPPTNKPRRDERTAYLEGQLSSKLLADSSHTLHSPKLEIIDEGEGLDEEEYATPLLDVPMDGDNGSFEAKVYKATLDKNQSYVTTGIADCIGICAVQPLSEEKSSIAMIHLTPSKLNDEQYIKEIFQNLAEGVKEPKDANLYIAGGAITEGSEDEDRELYDKALSIFDKVQDDSQFSKDKTTTYVPLSDNNSEEESGIDMHVNGYSKVTLQVFDSYY